MSTARELHRRGLQRSNAGRHAAARTLLLQALDQAVDVATAARIEFSLAHVEAELGAVEDGLARCRGALDRDGLTAAVCGVGWAQIGLLQMRAGDAEAALRAFDEAHRLLPAEAHEDRGNVRINRGNVHLQRAAADAALAEFDAAVEHFEIAGLPVHRDKARNNLGYAKLLVGDVAGAVADLEAAYGTLRNEGPVIAGTCDQDRAEALMAAGLPTDAAAALQRAEKAFGAQRFRQGQGEVLLQLARVRVRTDPAQARRDARRAMRLFTRRGSVTWAVRSEAVALRAEVAAGTRRRALRDDAARVGKALREQGMVHDAAQLELTVAGFDLATGEVDAADRRLASVPERDDEPLEHRLLRSEVRAAVESARGHAPAALDHVRAGLDELASWQSSFGSLDLQSSFVGHGRHLALTGLGLALDDERPHVVLEWLDRARALSTRVVPVRGPEDPGVAADLGRLRRLRAEIRDREASGQDVRTLLGEHHELRRRIREQAWAAPASGLIRDSVQLEEVHRALGEDDGVLLAHVTDGERLCALVVDSQRAEVVRLGPIDPILRALEGMRADLDVAASSVPDALRTVVRAGLDARLATLGEALLRPVEGWLGDERPVVLVPPGLLAGVPWTLLPGLRGRAVSVARSVGLWTTDRARTFAPARSAVLVAGPGVPRAEEEIARASAWSNATRLAGEEATSAGVSAAVAGADVLHLAAHGLHSADNPLFSGVELADGPWFGYDIDALGTVPETVLLSACELGRSTVRWGEEAVGMTAAWLHAGARTVIASPAAVSDDVACEVLAATHERLARGEPPAAALRDATEAVGLQGSSSFVCYGRGW